MNKKMSSSAQSLGKVISIYFYFNETFHIANEGIDFNCLVTLKY